MAIPSGLQISPPARGSMYSTPDYGGVLPRLRAIRGDAL